MLEHHLSVKEKPDDRGFDLIKSSDTRKIQDELKVEEP